MVTKGTAFKLADTKDKTMQPASLEPGMYLMNIVAASTVNQLIYQTVAPSKFSIEQGMFIEPIRLDRNGFA